MNTTGACADDILDDHSLGEAKGSAPPSSVVASPRRLVMESLTEEKGVRVNSRGEPQTPSCPRSSGHLQTERSGGWSPFHYIQSHKMVKTRVCFNGMVSIFKKGDIAEEKGHLFLSSPMHQPQLYHNRNMVTFKSNLG